MSDEEFFNMMKQNNWIVREQIILFFVDGRFAYVLVLKQLYN
jgi:hypothetical protein